MEELHYQRRDLLGPEVGLAVVVEGNPCPVKRWMSAEM